MYVRMYVYMYMRMNVYMYVRAYVRVVVYKWIDGNLQITGSDLLLMTR